ncbi:MAG TPA: M20 family metallopeptidase [Candidatus Limnocylindrales bacterium]|nr:M20 family metallopeptidase [Candidatus Limnocylindrales bacterium]
MARAERTPAPQSGSATGRSGSAAKSAPTSGRSGSATKSAARRAVDRSAPSLLSLSHRIHAEPEVGFEERQAAAWLGEALAEAGYAVTAGACELPTGFVATAGDGPLTVAICAEYDALPGIGHACGHNIIAASAVGAAIGLRDLADDLGLTVRIVGTPAEEGGGGKILMLERGAFDGAAAALMIHPSPRDVLRPPMLAVAHLLVSYAGRAAHASAHPEEGLNAADAITVAQVGLGLLRQHLRDGDRIHGIVRHGGDAANVVPARTTYELYLRATDLAALDRLRPRAQGCLEAGALATGCSLSVDEPSGVYAEVRHDPRLSESFGANARRLGRRMAETGDPRLAASTDMGNVSQVVPSIHPLLSFDTGGASNHQPAFAAACAGPSADALIVEAATLLAWTAIDLAGGAA